MSRLFSELVQLASGELKVAAPQFRPWQASAPSPVGSMASLETEDLLEESEELSHQGSPLAPTGSTLTSKGQPDLRPRYARPGPDANPAQFADDTRQSSGGRQRALSLREPSREAPSDSLRDTYSGARVTTVDRKAYLAPSRLAPTPLAGARKAIQERPAQDSLTRAPNAEPPRRSEDDQALKVSQRFARPSSTPDFVNPLEASPQSAAPVGSVGHAEKELNSPGLSLSIGRIEVKVQSPPSQGRASSSSVRPSRKQSRAPVRQSLAEYRASRRGR